ncbi:Adenosine deaminase CECR1-A [Mycena kentingensis (nom. inval.)]|nr:Adenosine deaminase CECR1-A [Mycena kentingensis (nom. inval.)]
MDSLAAYNDQRATLIAQDRALRRDHAATTSAAERKAAEYIKCLRTEESASVWGSEHEGVLHPFPGMEFLNGKSIIDKTKLFKVVSKMPKGALLHAHLDATVDFRTVLSLALQYPALHVRAAERLTSSNLGSVLPEFRALPKEEHPISDVSLTDANYVANTWAPLKTARECFLGGPAAFDAWAIAAATINPSEAYQTHNTVDKIWEKFTSTFLVSTGLIRFAPIWEQYIHQFLRSSVEDGISYVEVRINFYPRYMYSAEGHEDVPHTVWLEIFDTTLKRFKEELKQEGREDEFVGARIIYSTLRIITPEELEFYCEDCIALKQAFPHLIAGFDLVGAENVLKPLIYYAETLLRFRKRVEELGMDIPFILHAGETTGDGTEADMNLYDAILLGTKRIGHGFSVVKHPKLLSLCRERGILLEVCPISNEILRLTSSMPMHPLPIMMNNGVPVALSSDDPAMFGNMGLSYDFYQVLVSSEVTGLISLRELARDGILHSTLAEEDKEMCLRLWTKRWNKFIDWVVTL